MLYSTRAIEIPCDDTLKFEVVSKVTRAFAENYEVNSVDGARVSFPGGWVIIRASNTSPVLTFRAEAESYKGLKLIKEKAYRVLNRFPEIDANRLFNT